MTKHLTKHGNSLALVIDKPVLELLNINESTPLTVSTDGRTLFVSPELKQARRRKFVAALADTNKKYRRMLERLAK